MKRFFVAIVALVASVALFAQNPLPADPAVKVGKLDNGLTYYIRHNDQPAQRAEFYLATHAGAIQEAPDQDGLAHFLEHMCFNGLKNLPGKQMLDYLQHIGAEFGRNINASTGVEATQYMLNNMPVVREGIIDTCLLVMHDYSHFVLNEQEEIDAERGVILEERRTRRTAAWRIYEKSRPYLYGPTKYADCSLIGSQENLETFKRESLVNFYETWYRPDNQALIVVGDIDVDQIEQKIINLFADIPAPVNPRQKDVIVIPDNAEPVIGVVTDPEMTNTQVTLLWRRQAFPRQYNNTDAALTVDLIEDVISRVMAERFNDITSKPGAPFLDAYMGFSNIIETCEATMGDIACREGETLSAIEAFMTEIYRLVEYGVTEAELQRAKDQIISRLEKAVEGASTRKNAEFIRPLIANFNNNTYYMEPETRLTISKMILNQISAPLLAQVIGQLITEENFVVLIQGPEKEGLVYPSEAEILATIEKVAESDIEAPVEESSDEPLLDAAALKGAKVKKVFAAPNGATEWVLKNGVRVQLLPTEFKKDQILISLRKDGGSSLISNEDLYSFEDNIWALFQNNCGLSKFPASTLAKMLAGNTADANVNLGKYNHGISASCAPKDIETAFQLLYLCFVDPRFDADEYQVGIDQIKAVLPNLENNPQFAIQKRIPQTIYGGNPRSFAISEEVLQKASLATLEKNYRKLFADAAGATVTVVGNFDMAQIKPLVEKYIGSLPKGKKALKWKDNNDGVARGTVDDRFAVDMQTPKTTVLQIYSADIPYTVENDFMLDAVQYILDMIYTETLREDEGGTYGASVSASLTRQPAGRALMQVAFDTNPTSADKLASLARTGLETIATQGPTEEQMTRTVENFKKNIPESRINNSYWARVLSDNLVYGENFDALKEAAIAAISAEKIQALAKALLDSGDFIQMMMVPGVTAERE